MTYARKMAEKVEFVALECSDAERLRAVESVINEVIEACAREAEQWRGGGPLTREAAMRIRRLASTPPTTGAPPAGPDATDRARVLVSYLTRDLGAPKPTSTFDAPIPAAPVGEATTCAAWCGWWLRDAGEAHSHPTLALAFDDTERRSRAFCTTACRDAGRPLHPACPPTAPMCTACGGTGGVPCVGDCRELNDGHGHACGACLGSGRAPAAPEDVRLSHHDPKGRRKGR